MIRRAKLGLTITDGAILPGALLVGCDLRASNLDGKDLSGCTFAGCFLSANFRDARLDGAQLIGCFAPELSLGDANVVVRDCHVVESRWPDPAVAAALALMSENARDRNQALGSFGSLHFVIAAPLVAYLLEDGEWDVRLSALTALASLRGEAFAEMDAVPLEWMFYALGDDHSTVAAHMVEQIGVLRPGDAILRAAVDQMVSAEVADQLAGLRAARTLVYADAAYSRLLDIPAIEQLARAGAVEVRHECMRLAGYLGGADGLRLVLAGIAHEDPGTRVAALNSVALLDPRPHSLQLARLLADPDEDVRAAAVYALHQCPDFSAGLLARAAHDPSSKVRDAVAAVLADREA